MDEFNRQTAKKPKRKSKAAHAERFAATPARPAQTEFERLQQRALFDKHDAVTWSLRFPLPPSANQHWRIFQVPGGNARMILSAEGRAFREAVQAAWRSHWNGWTPDPLTARIRLLVSVSYFDRRKIDLDNRLKPLLDAMTEAKVWGDDSQIDAITVIRGPVSPGTGYADVTLETITEGNAKR